MEQEYVHTTARQRLRALRKEEGRKLYEQALQKIEHKVPSARGHSPSSVLNGVPVNHCGQLLDGHEPAITRLVRGDYYCKRGGAIGEVGARGEGKHHRFHDPEAPLALKSTAVETRAAAAGHSHRALGKRHHCHHGHRATHSDGENSDDESDNNGRNKGATAQQRPTRAAGTAKPPAPRYLTEGTVQSRNRQRPPATCEEQPLVASHATLPQSARGASRINPYETALQAVRAHEPGVAACISEKELDVIRRTATRVQTPRPASTSAAHKRPDQKQIFF